MPFMVELIYPPALCKPCGKVPPTEKKPARPLVIHRFAPIVYGCVELPAPPFTRRSCALAFSALTAVSSPMVPEIMMNGASYAAIPCGLVVNELISNALKHAFPDGREGEIRVHLAYETKDRVLLRVSDNGVGIPEDFDVQQTTSLGLQLVSLLVDQLAGEVHMQRANPTTFSLRFPLVRV